MKVAISDDCMNVLWGLPRDKQQAVMKFIGTFRQNPTSPGINYEKIRDAADPAMRSVRISQDYRGIVLKPDQGDVYVLLWVDHHNDAYAWARRHKVSIHPQQGALQVMQISHAGAVPPPQAPADPQGLFKDLKDRQLARLGVTEDLLPLVRSMKMEDELEACTQLPKAVYEALYLYVGGDSYESLVLDREEPASVDVSDYAEALERDSSRQHFLVITEDTDLDAILEGPLAAWRVFLHPSQRALVEKEWSGPVRVLGGAGTGKTVVAMHRAVWLARKYIDVPGKPVLFTTFTKTLAQDIRTQIATLAKPAEREKIEVTNIDQWALSILRGAGYRHELLWDPEKRSELWDKARTRKPDDLQLPDSFYQTEFERVVLPQGRESADDYVVASRVGRGVQLTRAQRRAIWPVFAEYKAQLRAANLREPEEAYRDARAILTREGGVRGIRAIVVDEAQDLSAAALGLLRAAVPEGPNDLFIVGDAHQRIYRHRVTLSRVGIDIKGRGRRLRINYRTTDEIRKWAVAELAGCAIDDLDGQPDSLVGYRSLVHGEAPEVVTSASREDERTLILERIRRLVAAHIPAQNICLVVHYNREAVEYANWLAGTGQAVLRLESTTPDDDARPGIRVATMHRVKGLKFDAVIVAGYHSPEYYARAYTDEEDAGAWLDHLTSERCLLHVAATRAKRYLLVSRIGP